MGVHLEKQEIARFYPVLPVGYAERGAFEMVKVLMRQKMRLEFGRARGDAAFRQPAKVSGYRLRKQDYRPLLRIILAEKDLRRVGACLRSPDDRDALVGDDRRDVRSLAPERIQRGGASPGQAIAHQIVFLPVGQEAAGSVCRQFAPGQAFAALAHVHRPFTPSWR